MVIQVKEKTIREIEEKFNQMNTDLNKISYLESVLKKDFMFEIKRFVLDKLTELYEERRMFEKAAKATAFKAGIDISFREKIESYLKAGELYAKTGKIKDAEEMFIRASREANIGQKQKIRLAMKNIFLVNAQELEKKGKKVGSLKFYERLIKMNLDDLEKKEIKEKLISIYKALGKFREAELVEGL